MKELLAAVKAKKGLETLDDAFVREKVERVFASDARIKRKYEEVEFKQFLRSQEYKTLLKKVRKELRTIYGVFQESERDPGMSAEQILESHTSTRERLPYYDQIYKELAMRIPSPKRLLDLGCGMNPLSYEHMQRHSWNPEIIASDISAQDMEFLLEAFVVHNIPGRTIALDLTQEFTMLTSLEANVTFLLKLLDSLEEAERHISYKIFENIKSKWIVVSFPTRSLGGKKRISTKGRSWFERLLHRFEYTWETFEVENELFYVIEQTLRR